MIKHFNYCKFTGALTLSLIGSEAFKLGASIYILKLTGDYWLVAILYLLIQIPSLLVYCFSHYLVQKITKIRATLLLVDLLSATILVVFVAVFHTLNQTSLANGLIVINALLGLIHAFRFIFLKELVYYVANNAQTMKTYNSLNSLGMGFGFLLSPIMGLVLYQIQFEWLIGFNIITYLVSGILYFWLSFYPSRLELLTQTTKTLPSQPQSCKTRIYLWTYVLSGSLLLGLISFPKQSGLTQVFQNLAQFDYNTWSFYFSIGFALMSLLGVLFTFYFNKIHKHHSRASIMVVSLGIGISGLLWLFFSFLPTTPLTQLLSYFLIVALQQFLFSIFLPMFYSQAYQLFSHQSFHRQNGISIVFRIIVSSLLVILFTFITKNWDYKYTYFTFATCVMVICVVLVYSYKQLRIIDSN